MNPISYSFFFVHLLFLLAYNNICLTCYLLVYSRHCDVTSWHNNNSTRTQCSNLFSTERYAPSQTHVEKQKLESVEDITAFWDSRTLVNLGYELISHSPWCHGGGGSNNVWLVPEWFVGGPQGLNQVYRRIRGDKVLRVHPQTWWWPRMECRTSTMVGRGVRYEFKTE